MPTNIVQLSSQLYLKLDGRWQGPEVMDNLAEVMVDQHCHMPHMFTLRLHDQEARIIEGTQFGLGQEVEVGAYASGARPLVLVKGRITAVEPTFSADGSAQYLVRGYDHSFQLYRERRSKTYVNMRDSDIARTIAQEAGLESNIEQTPLIYEHLYQQNQSNLSFLRERAWRLGYLCFVRDNCLYFTSSQRLNRAELTLTWGDNGLEIHPRLNTAERVTEVRVQGWNPDRQQPIIGRASQSELAPHIGALHQLNDPPHTLTLTDLDLVNEVEADLLAQARLDEMSAATVEMEGSVFRRPDIAAGAVIAIEGIGEQFSGNYLVTTASHIYTPSTGLETYFTVRGLRTGLLTEQIDHQMPMQKRFGLVTAVVTNNRDPKGWGRVRVKFPWLTEDEESSWARTLQVAGQKAFPAVGDEVIVAFDDGHFNRPLVMGTLINGRNGDPPASRRQQIPDAAERKNWQTPSGHHIALQDTQGEKQVTVTTAVGHEIKLDDSNQRVTISTAGGLTIQLNDRTQTIEIISGGNLSLSARGNLDLEATGQVNVRGTAINFN